MSGLDQNGFTKQQLQDVLNDVNAALQSTFGSFINLNAGSVFATLSGIFAERMASLWDLGEAIYLSQYPDTAIGPQLDLAMALRGLTRLSASYSRQFGQLFFGTVGTTVPQGTVLYVLGNPASQFSVDSAVTLIAGTNEVQTLGLPTVSTTGNTTSGSNQLTGLGIVTGIAAGQTITGSGIPGGTTVSSIVGATVTMSANATATASAVPVTFNLPPTAGTYTLSFNGQTTSLINYSGAAAAIQSALEALSTIGIGNCTVSGNWITGFVVTFTNSQGLQPQNSISLTNNLLTAQGGATPVTPTVTETTSGVAQGSTSLTALTVGPIVANSGTLTQFQTPVAGISRTTNPLAATVGSNIESDTAFRLRGKNSLRISAASSLDAIRSKLLILPTVQSVIIFPNDNDTTDGAGRPPHSFESIVLGGAPSDIATALWQSKPIAISTFGNTNYVITDSQGVNRTIYYSLPTVVQIYVTATLTTNSLFPANGHTQAVNAILNYINNLGLGNSVIVSPGLIAALNTIPGITGVTILLGTAPSPSGSANIAITQSQIPQTMATQIAVTP